MNNVKLHYGGIIGWVLERLGFVAITFGSHIWFSYKWYEERYLPHELIHVEQYKRYGIFGFIIRYLGSFLKNFITTRDFHYSYREIPLEKEAREKSGV